MNFNLHEILLEKLSDKEASHIANIFMELALAIESHYYAQIVRYDRTAETEYPFYNDSKNPF